MYIAPRISLETSQTKGATEYRQFRGVDFAHSPTEVDKSRSPNAPNLLSDDSGNPEKRPGWRTLYDYGAEIRGIHRITISGTEHILVHAGTKIYKHDATTPTELYTVTATSGKSFSVVYGNKLWILTGAEYLVYDGTSVVTVASVAHVPYISIGCTPATGAGTSLEPVNLLSASRIKSYLGDGSAVDYYVEDGATAIEKVTVNGTELSSGYSFSTSTYKVTFSTAPSEPAVVGQDNVIIQYTKAVSGYADKINKCRFMGLFGLGGNDSDRIFFSGNPDFPNCDFHCDIAYPAYAVDPSYVPDTSYAFIGSDNNAIMGYRRFGSYQLVIKAQNDQDASIFLRSAALDSNNNTMFGVEQGAAGVGAISMYAFANLNDDPLFLSKNGVFGVYSTSVANMANMQNRSYFVDKLLLAESDLDKAVACEWKGYYVLCINNRAYILDSRQFRVYNAKSTSYVYECFYWTNIPAVCLCEVDGTLYFGTANGKFCRFNTDIADSTAYNDDGEAIDAFWATPLDNDGDPLRYKSTQAVAVVLKPNTISSVKVYITTEKNSALLANTFTPDTFSFDDIDFSNFSFDTGNVVQTVPIQQQIKKYISLQITARNNTVNESFGIAQIAKKYVFNNNVRTVSGGVIT